MCVFCVLIFLSSRKSTRIFKSNKKTLWFIITRQRLVASSSSPIVEQFFLYFFPCHSILAFISKLFIILEQVYLTSFFFALSLFLSIFILFVLLFSLLLSCSIFLHLYSIFNTRFLLTQLVFFIYIYTRVCI